jgi:hypothetical protein
MSSLRCYNQATTTFALGSQFPHESKVVVAAFSGERGIFKNKKVDIFGLNDVEN